MVFKERPITVGSRKKKRGNRRRKTKKDSILFVDAKTKRKSSKSPSGVPLPVAIATVAIAVVVLSIGVVKGVRNLGGLLFAESPQFNIVNFDIRTNGVLKDVQIMDYGELALNMNLFEFDLDAMRSKIESSFIVKEAVVRRQLPDTLSIRVFEREAAARLGPEDSPIQKVVDLEGVLIRKSYKAGHLPLIKGINSTSYPLGSSIEESRAGDALEAIEFSQDKKFNSLLKLESIAVGHPEYLDVKLTTGERLMVPRNAIASKLRQAAVAIQVAEDHGKKIGRLDLTPKNDPIVQYL